MNQIVGIREDSLNQYAQQEVLKRLWVLIIPIGVAVFLSTSLGAFGGLINIILIFGVIAIVAFWIKREQAKSMRFSISEEAVAQNFDMSEIHPVANFLLSFSAARYKRRYGIELGRSISNTEINSIEFKTKEIAITLKGNDPLTNNGRISIPTAVEGYQEIQNHFEKVKEEYDI